LRTFRVRPSLPAELQPLMELAVNLRWAWDRPTRELFRSADPDLWDDVGGNPVALLGRLPQARLTALMGDADFMGRMAETHSDLQRYLTRDGWSQDGDPAPRVAYFSPEFGLTHAMQTYSGGLGVLAGDHLKATSDLGIEMVGVGLLYRHGYFHQLLDADGWQQERYPDLNPFDLPLRRFEHDGAPVTVSVELEGRSVDCQIWLAQVGRVPLLLLDTDVPTNAAEDRHVTDKLYGGDVEHRLKQEIVLGIGGMRALLKAQELGTVDGPSEVFHSNEGHAGFLQLERIRRLVVEEHLTFEEAIESARAAVLFTTHTPVPAGIDVFSRELIERYFSKMAADCGVDVAQLMALGQVDADGAGGDFNMAIMGMRLSAAANGVSQLHGRVSRRMFAPLWPHVAVDEVPIASITNGVHGPTWVGREMTQLYRRWLDADWTNTRTGWERIPDVPDEAIWEARREARARMVTEVRAWLRDQALRKGENRSALGWIDDVLDPEVLTIGFARRFAEYKRGTLLARHPERLRALLSDSERPVQFVFAGKAHPRDEIGKDIIRQLVHFSADEGLRTRFVFAEDYDMKLASVLVQGADVWLNNPRRPHEASGTSGEKSVLNGGLHCSTLDGWWDEMYDGENGFAIGGVGDPAGTAQQDAADAQALFDLLHRRVVPEFYDRDDGGLPRAWIARVRHSLDTLGPQVLASRMVREYAEQFYVPLARRARRLSADDHRRARDLVTWRRRLAATWRDVAVHAVDGDEDAANMGDHRDVQVVVHLGSLRPEDVIVELLHGPVLADGGISDPQSQRLEPVGRQGEAMVYSGSFECAIAGEYGVNVRVVPSHEDLRSWVDARVVTWAQGEGPAAGDRANEIAGLGVAD
ncbi:MAG TPA: alpha-glucan family phosphorylase, partial [Egibacteraceae bacterium]|nr:alpha-glucan family phosphorylase [Egibacteraceae bacterium]